MDYVVLSLPEASYLYMGLAIQALVRQSSLRFIPGVLVLAWVFVLMWRASQGHGTTYRSVLGYAGASLIILVLFWPEAVPFGQQGGNVSPDDVASYAAMADAGAQVRTAAETKDVPPGLTASALVPSGFRLLLRAITQTPLALARAISQTAHRPFSALQPMQMLMTQTLPADFLSAVADWTQACYVPAHVTFLQSQGSSTYEQLLPWSGPMQAELGQRAVIPGAQTGLQILAGLAGLREPVACTTYLSTMETKVQRWLFEAKTERGTPLRDMYANELGLPVQDQAQFVLYREIVRAMGPEVPAPSLIGTYAGLRAGAMAGKAAEGLGAGKAGGIAGAVTGAGNELQRAVDGASWMVGLAVWLTWWTPYIAGIINLVMVSLFPFILLWALLPGAQFQPLAHYFVALLFTCSLPLWWAMVDVISKIGLQEASGGIVANVAQAMTGWIWSGTLIALGVVLVPIVVSLCLFGAMRGIGNVWRGV